MADPSRIVVLAPNWLGDAVMAHGVDLSLTLQWKGRVLDRKGLRTDAAALRDAAFDAAVLLPNSMASAWLARRAGVPERWGYAADWRSPLLTRAVPKPRGSRHQAQYYQHLTDALGAPPGPLEPVLTATRDDVPGSPHFYLDRQGAYALIGIVLMFCGFKLAGPARMKHRGTPRKAQRRRMPASSHSESRCWQARARSPR